MKRSEIPPLRRRTTFVIPKWKLVFVSTPKAACTSIKWLLADLLEVPERKFYWSLSDETSRATTIHRASTVWEPSLTWPEDMTNAQFDEISPDNGWFTFTMTRHPASRLWSAWQSKLLIGEPRYMSRYADESWLPKAAPETTDDVIASWDAFIRSIALDPGQRIMSDVHFRPQAVLINLGGTPYDRIYDTSQYSEMLSDMRQHLEGQGWTGTITPRRSNETPLPAIRRAFPTHVVDAIADIFADDFTRLGYSNPLPPSLSDDDYSPLLMAATGIIIERGERIGDLSQKAIHFATKYRELTGTEPVASKTSQQKGLGKLRRAFSR
jgi:Sulfotransferase family